MSTIASEQKLHSSQGDATSTLLIGPGPAVAIAVGTGLLLRAAKGYRSFPSVDDFVYVPLARTTLDPGLFPKDTIVQEVVGHVPLWPVLIRGLESTVGLSLGLWLLTIVLSLVTALGMLRLIRGLGGSGLLLPLAAVMALAGSMNGLGRGTFDGAFGDAFHMQWVALNLLLFVYDAVMRQRYGLAGVLLGLTAICHPMVAAHGALAVSCSALFWGQQRWRLLITGALAFMVSIPVSIPIIAGILSKSPAAGATAQEIANLCYLVRLPHEYVIGRNAFLLYLVYVAVGLAGVSVLGERDEEPSRQSRSATLAGLFIGHIVILVAAVLLHGEMFGTIWTLDSLLPFQLHLTRTTPLLLVLSAVAATTAFEREVLCRGESHGPLRWGRVLFWCPVIWICLTLILGGTVWTPALVAMVLLGLATTALTLHQGFKGHKILVGVWIVAALVAVLWHGQASTLDAPLTLEETELHTWARNDTADDALFIVPPGMEAFRYYGQRSVYVDFKYFPTATPELLPEWRRRLEQIAAPDSIALEAKGFPSVAEWDRTYANRNTPRRIAGLLAETDADYLVWDRQGLDRPPYVPVDRRGDPRVGICFENDRFCVYRRKRVNP